VEALGQELKAAAEIVYPLETFPHGMREFAFRDNSGYVLLFGPEM
jgi:hypothetical protein